MTAGELIAILEGYPEDAEIFLAEQPRWPFKYDIKNVSSVIDDKNNVDVYIAEGEQIGYLSQDAAEQIGWI